MISLFGHVLLAMMLTISSAAIVIKGRIKIYSFFLSCLLPLFSFILLVIGFIKSDFELRNVFLNSSTELPLIYKIAASFASHEGSILLWDSLLGLVSLTYIYCARISKEAKDFGIMIFAFIQVLFVSFIIFTSNPFDSFSFIPAEGLGLNPMLQDMALSIHPPILYLGNVCYAALFTSGLILLYRPEERAPILELSKKFSSCALMLLTIGIGLGSWWAYRELGWGGYWFFDPVENISLLPWLSGIALHHFLIIFEQRSKFLRGIIILSILSFLLIIYGTFIVRSGIISSVHSFAFSPERGLFIFLICITMTVLSLFWFFLKQKELKISYSPERNKESLILLGNIFWLIALCVLVVALIYPIYCALVLAMDVVIDPGYFYAIFIPIFIPIIFLAAITPHVDKKLLIKRTLIFSLSTLGIIFIYLKIELGMVSIAIGFVSIFLILHMIEYVVFESNFFTSHLSLKKYALFLGHFGFGALALAVMLNCALSREVEFTGKVGDERKGQNLSIKLEDIKFSEGVNYFRQIAVFRIEDKNNNIVILKPENRLYKIEKTLSQEVDIFSFIFHDVYAVLSQIDKNTIHAKIYYQPMISFVWLSILIIALGFCLSWWSQGESNPRPFACHANALPTEL